MLDCAKEIRLTEEKANSWEIIWITLKMFLIFTYRLFKIQQVSDHTLGF